MFKYCKLKVKDIQALFHVILLLMFLCSIILNHRPAGLHSPHKCPNRSISSAKLPFLWKEARFKVLIKPQVYTFYGMVPSYAIFSHCFHLPFPRATVIDLMRNIPNRGVGLLVYNSKFALSYRARAWAVMRSITVKGLFFFCTVLVKVI